VSSGEARNYIGSLPAGKASKENRRTQAGFDGHCKAAQIDALSGKTVTKKLYAHPDWESCTFEGAELSTLRLGLQTTFREKLEWLEEAETSSLRLISIRPGKLAGSGIKSRLIWVVITGNFNRRHL
jgi:hypothetical protein